MIDDDRALCLVCKKQILESEKKVPHYEGDYMGYAHKKCENDTNTYMKYDNDDEPYLTWKGQIMMGLKLFFILGYMINEKLHGRPFDPFGD